MIRLLSILRHPSTAIVLGGIVVFDAIAISELPAYPRGCVLPLRIPIVRTESGLGPATDTTELEQVAGWVSAFNRIPRYTGAWARTARLLDPRVAYNAIDGSAPTPAELAKVRAIYADEIQGSFDDPALASVIRAGGPARREPIVSGYVHDALALAVLGAFLLASTCAIAEVRRSSRAESRLRRGLCPACGYDLAGVPPETPCPECGTTR